MNTYTIHRASPTDPGNPVSEATIAIGPSIDDSTDSRLQSRIDGSVLANALWSHLPGATLDELIACLLSRRASQFRVRFAGEAVSA